MSTLCEIGFSELLVEFTVDSDWRIAESFVGMFEPWPIDWFWLSKTRILNTGALCFNRISLAKWTKNSNQYSIIQFRNHLHNEQGFEYSVAMADPFVVVAGGDSRPFIE